MISLKIPFICTLKGNRVDYSHYDDHSTGAALQFGIDTNESDLLSFAVHWKDDVHRAQKEKTVIGYVLKIELGH